MVKTNHPYHFNLCFIPSILVDSCENCILGENNITLDRPVTVIIGIEGQNLIWNEVIQVTLDSDLADMLGDSILH